MGPEIAQAPDCLKTAMNRVELAASVLGGIPGFMAYHTSVVVNGEEFFFSNHGVMRTRDLQSHDGANAKPEVIEMGYSPKTGPAMLRALEHHFEIGTYDLLHKNCNSFTDVALHYLLGARLETKYNSLEKLGASNVDLLTRISGQAYQPNPLAVGFDVEQLFQDLVREEQERKDRVAAAKDKMKDVGSQHRPQPTPARKPSREGAFRPPFGNDNNSDAEGQAQEEAEGGDLGCGSAVRVGGLTSEAGKELNGELGAVLRFDPERGRYEILLASGETKALKPEYLQCELSCGSAVRVTGLTSEAGQKLNGELGTVLRYDPEKGRYEVRFKAGDGARALRPENLQCSLATDDAGAGAWAWAGDESARPRLAPGVRVRIERLLSEAVQQLNGQEATFVRFNADAGRCEVRLDNGEVKAVRPGNLELV